MAMKRCLAMFLILVLFASVAAAGDFTAFPNFPNRAGGMNQFDKGTGGVVVPESVLKDSQDASDDYDYLGNDAGHEYFGTSFVATSSYTLTSFQLKMYKTGSPTGTITGYVHADTGSGLPGTLLGTSVNTIDASTVAAGTPGDFSGTVPFSGVSITNGTKYYLVVRKPTVDASNYVTMRQKFNTVTGNNTALRGDAGAWQAMFADTQLSFKTYGY
jgi:hypothetical protein